MASSKDLEELEAELAISEDSDVYSKKIKAKTD